MANLKLQVINGPIPGQEFHLHEDQILGRGSFDISINDPKISGKHAKIQRNKATGGLEMVDLGSTNGLKVDNKMLRLVQLVPGLRIRIGNTLVIVIEDHAVINNAPPPLPEEPDAQTLPPVGLKARAPAQSKTRPSPEVRRPGAAQTRSKEKPARRNASATDGSLPPLPPRSSSRRPSATARTEDRKPDPAVRPTSPTATTEPPPLGTATADEATTTSTNTWNAYFDNFCQRSLLKIDDDLNFTLLPFAPLLELTIVRGVQAGTVWTLGYGPRMIGLNSLDFHLFEPSAPDIAFLVEPKNSLAQFKTRHADRVLLNGKSVSSEILNDGDLISVADTVIRVNYKS